MLIDDSELYDKVWNRVYTQLNFKPDCQYRGHTFHANVPFVIMDECSVYGIENMSDAHIDSMDEIIRNIFIHITSEGERIYALDWQHSAFLYHPGDEEEQKRIWVANENFSGDGYYARFPAFFPDGDYYFFIDENFRFGYLGHPWRREVWIFGELLTCEFDKVYEKLGWMKLWESGKTAFVSGWQSCIMSLWISL